MPDRRSRAWRWRSVVAASTVVVLGAGGYAAYAQTSKPTTSSDYRVASVARGSVSQTVTLTGTVSRVAQVTAKFPVSGAVTGLSVQVGQAVTAGQQLATIDQAPLLAALTDAQAQLAQAQAQLTADSTAPTSTTASGATQASSAAAKTSSSSARTATSASSTGSAGGSNAPTQPPVAMPDQAPLKAAVAAMKDAAKAETTACAPVLAAQPKTPPPGTTPSSTSTTPSGTSTTPSGTSTTSSSGGAVTAEQIATCVPALQAWSTALTTAQAAVQDYSTALATAQQQLDKQAAAVKSTSSNAGSGAAQSSGATQSSAASTSAARTSGASSGSSSGATATPQAILAKQLTDQAAITAAENGVASAQSNLAAATLTAPIAGIVGQIGLTPGQGESGSQGITIVGTGAATVSVEVPLATIASIKQGDAATVAPPGLAALPGSVSQISLLPTSTTTATPTYAVTVLLPDAPQVLATGSKVTTSIVTATAANVLTVPASAAQGSTSGSGRVDVLKDGQLSSVTVALGAVGGGLVEVRSGLNEGDHVVIANVAAPLPTNQSQFVRGLTGGGGAGGGGAGGGGAGQGGAGQTSRRGG